MQKLGKSWVRNPVALVVSLPCSAAPGIEFAPGESPPRPIGNASATVKLELTLCIRSQKKPLVFRLAAFRLWGFPALLDLLFASLLRNPICDQLAEPLRAFLLPLAKLADSQITEIGFLAPVNRSGRTMPGFPTAALILFPLKVFKLRQLIPATGTCFSRVLGTFGRTFFFRFGHTFR